MFASGTFWEQTLGSATQVCRLQSISLQCEYYGGKLKINLMSWLLRHLEQALNCIVDCQSRLDLLYQSPNQYTTENYTQTFLEEQWTKERNHYKNCKDDEVDQAIELGKLLSLEDELRTAW
ncbi:hypothetical protein PtB15_11B163 [Puccinia triticina]|nr:hypothetical protein PtB15_11B163 [Puccinia triticina]